MSDWKASAVTVDTGGRFQIVITGRGKNARSVDVTSFRGAPTQIGDYSDADPFGDATATLTFPTLSPFDDLDSPELNGWLMEGAKVDIYWRPSQQADDVAYPGARKVINPKTEKPDLVTPVYLNDSGGSRLGVNRRPCWEGNIASIKATADDTSFGLPITCQGALFQLDRYRAQPFYPPDPWPMELLIEEQFKRHLRPHLLTRPLITAFPGSWKKKIPAYDPHSRTPYTIAGEPGTLWSGLSTRNTGAWQNALTGFVQDLLTVMITRQGDGAKPGNQWTIRHYRRGESLPAGTDRHNKSIRGSTSAGRQPVLLVRDRFADADFTLQLGAFGVKVDLDRDYTQAVDVIFGDGTDLDGQTWRNATISTNGARTTYAPLAAERAVYPYTAAKRDSKKLPLEGYTKYGNGFSLEDGISIAAQQLALQMNPGWQGTIELKVDPSSDLSRWDIHSGMVVSLLGFMGTGADGVKFHIAQAKHSPELGTVTLTVDTRFRDLLTVEESIARTRDPLTPVKMLQVNKASVMIDDVQAPWDYSAGSGFVPTKSKDFFKQKHADDPFPYVASTRRFPPSVYPHYYAGPLHSSAPRSIGRWYGPVQILTSARDTIARTEFVCVDYYGRPKKIPFHVSIYYVNVTVTAMPHLDGEWSPYLNNAFERVDPATGFQVNPLLWPDNSFIIGWGNKVDGKFDRPGFWPGNEASGAPPTGVFADDSTWQYDNTQYHQYFKSANPPGTRYKDTDISIYAMFYAEANEPVYFLGRLFRQNPGTS